VTIVSGDVPSVEQLTPIEEVECSIEEHLAEESKRQQQLRQMKSEESNANNLMKNRDNIEQNHEEVQDRISDCENEIIDERLKNVHIYTLDECLFCPVRSENFKRNMEHMIYEHGFFIPDTEYIKDLEGFITYLGEKVFVGNICLYCNGKGKTFWSFDAVQRHMRDLNHCKILYEGNEEEYEEYFDFSSDYEGLSSKEAIEIIKPAATLSENGCELILNDGKAIGHRSLIVYYKQKIKPPLPSRNLAIIDNLTKQNKSLGWHEAYSHQNLVNTYHQPSFKRKLRIQASFDLSIGIKNNNQKHHREQIN